jgi:hypothetical protein
MEEHQEELPVVLVAGPDSHALCNFSNRRLSEAYHFRAELRTAHHIELEGVAGVAHNRDLGHHSRHVLVVAVDKRIP